MLRFKRAEKTSFIERLLALHRWLQSGEGDYLLKAERRQLEQELHYIFGYHACQMTIAPGAGLLNTSQVSHISLLNPSMALTRVLDNVSCRDCDSLVITDPFHWPVSPGTLDLVLLHHVVEFSERPHRLLSEAARTIIPGGKLLVIGFNPKSLLNYWRWVSPKHRQLFQGSHLISPGRMRDWLTLLGFNVEKINYGAYMHPLDRHSKGLTRELVEQRCRQWNLSMGGFYMMVATQETPGMTPVRPAWAEVKRRFASNPIAGTSSCVGGSAGRERSRE
ncbi:class I SAM-dependent methyltransferase [Endozoicomonas gorgoniicola]|uniref:Class I SAM-dependent methyltransferase n=1 Tax=Endozoicomonas gorgoniicola TaxID=1234144 RepID=A0ABT3MT24_9GAMM|nr:class I SAM-dependent methyltransferase [Endozoicomonas gorgoniicola]MCW7552532.1 class I SAM-dependent methyltransferase [Endozoicomonas gorgoniicola]